ncbi:NAD-dependent epimerase/dehydratase family protein [Brevundimonas sp. M1A4_2e]
MRYFNAAGTDSEGELGEDHDPETHLIPLLVRASRGEAPPLTAFGGRFHNTRNGTPIRDYVHVEDLAAAYLLVLEQLFQGQTDLVLNAGAGGRVSVRAVLQAAQNCLGRRVPAVVGARREGDPPMLVADTSRLTRQGWAPRKSLQDMIISAALWREKTPPVVSPRTRPEPRRSRWRPSGRPRPSPQSHARWRGGTSPSG